MAEVLVIAPVVASAIAFGSKLYFQVNGVVDTVREAPTELRGVEVELKSLCSILDHLQKELDDGETSQAMFPFDDSAEHFRHVLENCLDCFSELQSLVQKYRELSFRKEIRWAMSGLDALKRHRARLEQCKSSISLFLQVARSFQARQTAQAVNTVQVDAREILNIVRRLDKQRQQSDAGSSMFYEQVETKNEPRLQPDAVLQREEDVPADNLGKEIEITVSPVDTIATCIADFKISENVSPRATASSKLQVQTDDLEIQAKGEGSKSPTSIHDRVRGSSMSSLSDSITRDMMRHDSKASSLLSVDESNISPLLPRPGMDRILTTASAPVTTPSRLSKASSHYSMDDIDVLRNIRARQLLDATKRSDLELDLLEACNPSRPGSISLGGIVKLFESGADLNAIRHKDNGEAWNALQGAAFKRDWKLIKWMLDREADPNQITKGDFGTALVAACSFSSPDQQKPAFVDPVIELLLDRGADINVFGFGDKASSALNVTCFLGQHETVSYLLSRGANPNVVCPRYGDALGSVLTLQKIPDAILLQMIRKLAKSKANMKSVHARAPYMQSVNGVLGKFGICVDGPPFENCDVTAWSPIALVAALPHFDRSPVFTSSNDSTKDFLRTQMRIIDCLLELGAEINPSTLNQVLPIEAAIARESTPLLKFLISKGANVTTNFSWGGTPLVAAAKRLWTDGIKILLESGAKFQTSGDRHTDPIAAANAVNLQGLSGGVREFRHKKKVVSLLQSARK